MRASEIDNIINKFKADNSPYRCILISGYWGVGKTYEVRRACKDDIYISLFGLSSADDIYKILLTKTAKFEFSKKADGLY